MATPSFYHKVHEFLLVKDVPRAMRENSPLNFSEPSGPGVLRPRTTPANGTPVLRDKTLPRSLTDLPYK